ncbi:trimeric LpxA-like protein [Scenedesmus sp. NREL 46B-D3]|nr:trimeric LpxA-like protein [Scenedesmus sp. NREL 46B-D3]
MQLAQQRLRQVSTHDRQHSNRIAAAQRRAVRPSRLTVTNAAAPDISTQLSSSTTELDEVRQSLAARLASSDVIMQPYSLPGVPDDYHPSQGWRPLPHHLSKPDIWQRIRQEAKADADAEPTLASFLYSSILGHSSFEKSLNFILANKLASPTLYSTQLVKIIEDCYKEEPSIVDAALADMQACFDRDPACDKYTQCLLYFKGFQAIQCHRIAHHLWGKGRKMLAVALQSRISESFHVDIHPAATFGRGILLDHATGVVVGETAVVGDNVSMLHHVTLGGSGTGKGIRHPTIGHGVLLGAGVSVLGNVTVGCGAKVGAGSVVVTDLPCHSVAVGVPARIVKQTARSEPCQTMDQIEDFILDYVI